MCISYRAATPATIKESFSASVASLQLWKDDVWQDYDAPIIRANDQERYTTIASYGFLPKRRQTGPKLTTMNARIEDIGTRRNYKNFWQDGGHLCLVPLTWFYEPNWETGVHVRYRIGMADNTPFAVAGMWREWKEDDGATSYSFTQLTMNADDHPLMKRFHKPGDEKRSLIILPRDDWDDWLMCRDPERARTFAQPFPAELMAAEPAPLPPRKKKEADIEPASLF